MIRLLFKSSFDIYLSSSTLPLLARITQTQHLAAITTLLAIQPSIVFATPQDLTSSQIYAQLPQTLPPQRPASEQNKPLQPFLPPAEKLVPSTPADREQRYNPADSTKKIIVKRFEVVGNTVLPPAKLAVITGLATNIELDFAQLSKVASDVTQLYISEGYVTSGAYLSADQSAFNQNGVIRIQVIEGGVDDIVIEKIEGTQRLDRNYIKSRIALGAVKPLKIDRLLKSLQLLQLDPLIKSISTKLVASKEPGMSTVQITVTENPTWRTGFNIANNRSPSVGEIQGQAYVSQSDLFGIGDGIGVSYARTEGSNTFDFNYTLPLNPHNGTLRFQYSNSNSKVIESPFDKLDINAKFQDFSLTYRQPLFQTPAQEFALGLTLTKREANTVYLQSVIGEAIPYPADGIDANGNTQVTAARLFQEYTIRDSQQVFALRSQLSVGINTLNATITPSSPDSKFLAWSGKAQYVNSFAPNNIFLVKVESQLADRPLLALEQIGLGGQETVRGYRQDFLLRDNGILASAEVRVPIFTPSDGKQLLQIVPFFDIGRAWNKSNSLSLPDCNIAATGLGVRYQSNDNFFAKLDYGIPVFGSDNVKCTGQEKGLYFSLNYNYSF
jgi:hemolysin activation/secretion protein